MPTQDPAIDLRGTAYCAQFNLRRTARAVTRYFDTAFQELGIRSTQFTILVAVAIVEFLRANIPKYFERRK